MLVPPHVAVAQVLAVGDCCRYADPIDPPTVSMLFGVNDSPLAGRDGKQLTSTMIADRLAKEAETNVAVNITQAPSIEGMSDALEVQGRGEMQLAVLIETMRREGFELSVSPPRVLFREDEDGSTLEPWELVVIDGAWLLASCFRVFVCSHTWTHARTSR